MDNAMIKLEVQEVLKEAPWYGRKEEKVYKSWIVAGKNQEECFKNIYPSERSMRYCNDRYLRINPPEMNDAYKKWKSHGVTFEMYYGSGTVD